MSTSFRLLIIWGQQHFLLDNYTTTAYVHFVLFVSCFVMSVDTLIIDSASPTFIGVIMHSLQFTFDRLF